MVLAQQLWAIEERGATSEASSIASRKTRAILRQFTVHPESDAVDLASPSHLASLAANIWLTREVDYVSPRAAYGNIQAGLGVACL